MANKLFGFTLLLLVIFGIADGSDNDDSVVLEYRDVKEQMDKLAEVIPEEYRGYYEPLVQRLGVNRMANFGGCITFEGLRDCFGKIVNCFFYVATMYNPTHCVISLVCHGRKVGSCANYLFEGTMWDLGPPPKPSGTLPPADGLEDDSGIVEFHDLKAELNRLNGYIPYPLRALYEPFAQRIGVTRMLNFAGCITFDGMRDCFGRIVTCFFYVATAFNPAHCVMSLRCAGNEVGYCANYLFHGTMFDLSRPEPSTITTTTTGTQTTTTPPPTITLHNDDWWE